jgi:hypothetical protein
MASTDTINSRTASGSRLTCQALATAADAPAASTAFIAYPDALRQWIAIGAIATTWPAHVPLPFCTVSAADASNARLVRGDKDRGTETSRQT